MENRAHAFLAGLFTIGLAIFIALAVVWFNRDQTVRVPYEVVTRSTVNGLSPQAAVKYRGLDVGKVDSIRFDDRVPGQIIVRVLVDKDAPITTTTYGRLAYQGVTGLAYVQLDDRGYDGGKRAANPTRLETSDRRPARNRHGGRLSRRARQARRPDAGPDRPDAELALRAVRR